MHKTLLLFVILLGIFSNIYAENDDRIILEQVTSDQRVKVEVLWPEVLPHELYEIELVFVDPQTNKTISNIISFDVLIDQSEHIIESYRDLVTKDGKSHFLVQFSEDLDGPAKLKVTINSILEEGKLVEINESLIFEVKVVPEFSFFAIVVMALSTMSILILTKFQRIFKKYFEFQT